MMSDLLSGIVLTVCITIITAIQLSLGGSSPYTTTTKQIRINIHKWNNTKNTVQRVQKPIIFSYVLLTVHLSIILVINQLNAQILVL